MKLLITGADGFVGKHVVKKAVECGYDVVVVTRSVRQPKSKRIENIQCNLLEEESWSNLDLALSSVDAVIHLAAIMPAEDVTLNDYNTGNRDFTAYLLRSIKGKACSFIYFSSIGVFGDLDQDGINEETQFNIGEALHPYFQSKLNAEELIESQKGTMPTYVFRLSSPYGPLMPQKSVLPLFVNKALKGESVHWHGSGARTQDFIYVDDVADICLKAAQGSAPDGFYYLTQGETTTMRKLAETIAGYTNVGASPSGQNDVQESKVWSIDNAKLKTAFGINKMTSLKDGIGGYIASQKDVTLNDALIWWND